MKTGKAPDSHVQERVRTFFEKYPKVCFRARDLVIDAAQTPSVVYFIATGEVRQYDISSSGADITLNTYREGAFFSMSWVLGDVENSFYYEATQSCDVHLAPIADVRALLIADPEITRDVLTRISRGLDSLLHRLSAHMAAPATCRIAVELVMAARKTKMNTKSVPFPIELTVNQLAARSGLARETASRQLAQLVRVGCVQKTGRAIMITNLPVLESIASGEVV